MQTIIFALILVLIAGFINGSFATPMKFMTKWSEENTWFAFSFWGFLILPWITILFMVPHTFKVVSSLPSNLLSSILVGGIVFGLGQIAFALSFRYIGIGLAFVVNISMGTAGSALIPLLWHKNLLGTEYTYMQIAGIVIFVFAVSFGAAAGAARDRNRKEAKPQSTQGKAVKEIKTGKHLLGIVLAMLAGVGSICQGVSYIWANPSISKIATSEFGVGTLAASIIAWVIIFSAAWIPYCCYFLVLNFKNKGFSNFKISVISIPNFSIIILQN